MKSNKSILNMFLLLSNFVIIIFLLFTDNTYDFEFQWIIEVFILTNFIFFFYFYFKDKYENKFNHAVDRINKHLSDIVNDKKVNMTSLSLDKELINFHEKLLEVNDWTNEKDNFYTAILDLVNSVAINIDVVKTLETILPKIIETTKSNCGAFYIVNNTTNRMEIKNSIGFNKNIYREFDISIDEGFFGLSILDNEIKLVKDLPDDSIYLIRTFLGKIKPKNVLIVPIPNNDDTVGVLVLASVKDYTDAHKGILNVIRSYIGVSINNSLIFERTKRLTNELKFQNRLIQDLNEDLEIKVSNRTSYLNNIIDNLEECAIFSVDKQFIITAWNTGAEKIYGYKSNEAIGKPLDSFHEFDNIRQNLDTLLNTGRFAQRGWEKHKDGSEYFADTTIFKIHDDKDNLLGFTNVTRDITSVYNLEKELDYEKNLINHIINSIDKPLIICDINGEIVSFNNSSSNLLKEINLTDKNMLDYVIEKDIFMQNLKAIAKKKNYKKNVFTLVETGQQLTFETTLLKNIDNTPEKIICILNVKQMSVIENIL